MLTWPRPPRRWPTSEPGEGDDALRDAAAHHQVAGIDEERDGEQREDVHARVHLLEDDQRRQAHIERRWQSSRRRGRRRSACRSASAGVKTPKRIQRSP